MWLKKNARLSERASYNCIDLTGYFHYPTDVMEKILIAMEEGCTRHQIDTVLQESGRREIINELTNIRSVPDVEYFTKRISKLLKKSCGLDIRENIKLLEFILPEDNPHGWSTSKSHITLQTIERHLEEEELEVSIQFLHFLVADRLIARGKIDYFKELNSIAGSFFTDSRFENKTLCLPNIKQMELLAMYYAVSGMRAEEAVNLCGKTAAAIGFLPRQTYHMMLETATLILMNQVGITAGYTYLVQNKLPARYEIMQIGFQKKPHAVLCQEPPLLLEVCTPICCHAGRLSEALFSMNPEHATILACQIFAETVSHTAGIWSDITVPKDKKQYMDEVLSYFRKEVVENVRNYK